MKINAQKHRKQLMYITLFTVMLMLCRTAYSSETSWSSTNGLKKTPASKDVSASVGGVLYAADTTYLVKSTNNGDSWDTTGYKLKLPLVVSVNPDTNSKVVVAIKGKIYYSENGFDEADITAGDGNDNPYAMKFYRHPAHPGTVYLLTKAQPTQGGTYSSLRVSFNNGLTWTGIDYFKAYSGDFHPDLADMAIPPGSTPDSNHFIVGAAGNDDAGLYESSNGGVTWTKNTLIKPSGGITAVASVILNGNLEQYAGSSYGLFYRKPYTSNSSGWGVKKPGEFKNKPITAIRGLANGDVVLASRGFGVFISTDSGTTWKSLNGKKAHKLENLYVQSLTFNPTDENLWYATTESGVYQGRFYPTPDTVEWAFQPSETEIANSGVMASSSSTLISATPATYKVYGRMATYSFIGQYAGDTLHWTNADMSFVGKKFIAANIFYWSDSGRFYAVGGSGEYIGAGFTGKGNSIIARSTNGTTWDTSEFTGAPKACINGIFKWKGTLYAYGTLAKDSGGNKTNLLKRINYGSHVSWKKPSIKLPFTKEVVAMDAINSAKVAVAFYGKTGFWLSLDSGKVWNRQTSVNVGGNNKSISTVNKIINDGTKFYIAATGGLFKWEPDSGCTLLLDYNTTQVVYDNNKLFAINSDGLKSYVWKGTYTTDNGWSWATISDDLKDEDGRHINLINNITLQSSTLYASTPVGIFGRNLSASTGTTVSEEEENTDIPYIEWWANSGVNIDETMVIQPHQTLKIDKGVTVNIAPGAQLRVYGKLIIEGTDDAHVTLQSSDRPTKCEGIYLASGSVANIEYADITDARVGIFCAKSEVSITSSHITDCTLGVGFVGMQSTPPMLEGNSITDCGWGVACISGADVIFNNNDIAECEKGIFIDASSPMLYGNSISHNTEVGVVVYGGGYPRFGDYRADQPGLNIVQGNDITQIMAVQGYAFLGFLDPDCVTNHGGGNLIAGTDPEQPLLVAIEQSNIISMRQNWGLAEVSDDDFLQDDNSQIIFTCLSSDYENASGAQKDIWDAMELRGSGIYTDAVEKYKYVIQNYSSTNEAIQAVNELYQMMVAAEIDSPSISGDLQSYFESLVGLNINSAITNAANKILAQEYDRWDEAIESLNQYNQVLSEDLNEDTRISALLSKSLIESADLDYPDDAWDTYTTMYNNYSSDERTQMAQLLGSVILQEELPGGSSKSGKFKVAMRTLPKQNPNQTANNLPKVFALHPNYPNPFNPTTTIKYDLPKDVHVMMKIYDVLGREVATLINEDQPAGYKSVQFDASMLSSGLYFYRLKAGEFIQNRKMMLIK